MIDGQTTIKNYRRRKKLVFETPHTSRRDKTRRQLTNTSKTVQFRRDGWCVGGIRETAHESRLTRMLRTAVSVVSLCPQIFYRSIISACGHFGTIATVHFVCHSILSAVILIVPLCPHADTNKRLLRSILSSVPLCPQCFHCSIIVFACGYFGTTAVSRYVHVGVEPFLTNKSMFYILSKVV